VVSAFAFSVSGVLTKAIQADVGTIACWRGSIGGMLIVAYVAWRGRKRPLTATFGLGYRGWLLASIGAVASVAFIASFKLTYVANVTVIYATAPFLAAGVSWIMARERTPPQTLVAASVSLVGIVIIVGGGTGSDRLAGDMLAIAMTMLMALYMALVRMWCNTPVVLAGGVSALQLFALGWFVTNPQAVSGVDMTLLTLFGVFFATASILLTEGARLVAASDAALASTVETPFAILLAWAILTEVPPAGSLVGGAVVLAAVAARVAMEHRVVGTRTGG
jgi:drug/metabolite transporter (DMT)-like permease